MSFVILNSDQLPASSAPLQEAKGRIRKILSSWIIRNATLRRQWKQYSALSTGRRIPYRAWSRHGAYIALLRESSD